MRATHSIPSIPFAAKLLPCAAAVLLAGCAVQPVTKNADMVHKDQTIVVVSNTLPKPGFYRFGQQGLLDIAINHAVTSTVASRMEALTVPGIDNVRDQVAQVLTEKGYKVVVEPTAIDVKGLPKYSGSQLHKTTGDWSAWGDAHHADYVLLVSLVNYGAGRMYYGFMPTTAPYPLSTMSAELVDPKTNTVVWADTVNAGAQQVPDWDTPPDYDVLTHRIEKTYTDNVQLMVSTVKYDFKNLLVDTTGAVSTTNERAVAAASPTTASVNVSGSTASK
jgi:hypothetical protein